MILFLINKNLTQVDILECTGIKPKNVWFEYFMSLFASNTDRFDNLTSLVKVMTTLYGDNVLRKLKAYDIDGDFFLYKSIIMIKKDFENIDFTKIKFKVKDIRIIDF